MFKGGRKKLRNLTKIGMSPYMNWLLMKWLVHFWITTLVVRVLLAYILHGGGAQIFFGMIYLCHLVETE